MTPVFGAGPARLLAVGLVLLRARRKLLLELCDVDPFRVPGEGEQVDVLILGELVDCGCDGRGLVLDMGGG